MKYYYIPHNLRLDELVHENFPKFKPFKKQKLAYILSLLNKLRISNKDLLFDSYTPLNAQLLQEYVKNYKDYLNYLINDLKIVETDNQYITKKKSRGYRFIDTYQTMVKPYKVTDWTMRKKMKIEENKALLTVKKLNYLTKWFNDGLEIDFNKCHTFLKREFNIKNRYPELKDYNVVKQKYKIPLNQLNRSLIAASTIDIKSFFLKRDNNVNRFHSNLTNLNSQLRNAITYKGEQLISIDIANSQPYLSTLLFKKEFLEKKSQVSSTDTSNYITINKLPNNYFYYIMLGETPVSLDIKGFVKYIDLVRRGLLYEYLQKQFKEQLRVGYASRKQVKTAVFQTLFTSNTFIGQKEAAPKKIFAELFPEVYEIFKHIKKKDKTTLPRLLQSIESYLIIDVICKRIGKELPQAPIFTIHDSIATTKEYVGVVQQIMLEECTNAIGFAPKLTIEKWEKKKMDKYLDELKNRATSIEVA
jgi:hypothetical protein